MQNFKADQRQLMVTDDGSGGWIALVAPAGAAAALVLRGSLAAAMLASELQIAAWSADDDRLPTAPHMDGRGVGTIDARFLTEGAILSALLDALSVAGGGDRIRIAVENFSDNRLLRHGLVAGDTHRGSRGALARGLLALSVRGSQRTMEFLSFWRESGPRG